MSTSRMQRRPLRAQGFTILELMIATVVFSVVLLVVTYGILQISRTYYKGINESNTQTVARSIMDTIGQSIQFNGGEVTTNDMTAPYVFCVGSQQYTFRPGWVVTDTSTPIAAQHQTPHGLYVKDNVAFCNTASPAVMNNVSLAGGRELLGTNMRVASLKVTSAGTNQYRINLRVIYGSDDFLYSPSGDAKGPEAPDAKCKGSSRNAGAANAGTSQFCSVSELSTTVTKRVK